MRTRFRVFLVLLVLLLVPAPGFPQAPPVFEGGEVTVAGRRPQPVAATPAYVTVIPGEELRRLGFLTVGDALAFLAEAYVRTAGSGVGGLQQLSIRGATPQQVLVLLDGVPLNATAQFGINLATISLADVERVEILRGPYSALYGSAALGGVVSIVTRSQPQRRVLGTYGSFGTAQAAVSLGGATGALLYGLGAELLATGEARPNADANRLTAHARFTLSVGEQSQLGLAVHHTSGRGGLPGPSYAPTPSDRLADRRTVASLTWMRGDPTAPDPQIRVWWYEDGLDYTAPGYGSVAQGSAYGVDWQRVLRLREGAILTVGGEYQGTAYRFADSFGGYAKDAWTVSSYAQYDFAATDRTLVGVGVRYDLHSVWGGVLNPRLGFVHVLGPGVRLRGGVGRTFRGPTFGELFFPNCSDPHLKPESAWSLDLGLEGSTRPGLLVRVGGFYTDAENLITGGCPPRNVGSARITGTSAEAVGRIGDRWQLLANVTWTDGLDRTTGVRLLRLPTWTANLILRYTLDPQSALALVANYVGERDDLDFSQFPPQRVTLPSYVTLGLRYEVQRGGWTIRLVVDNLLDAPYETLRGYPSPGRTYGLQVSGSF